MLPASCKEARYKEIVDIDFTSPGKLRKKMIKGLLTMEIKKIQEPPTYRKANYASDEKVSEFYKHLSVCKSKRAILSIIPPFDEKYVPQTITEVYLKKLSEFYDPLKEKSLNYLELPDLGNSLDINISHQQQSNVEKLTRAQANSENDLIIEVVV